MLSALFAREIKRLNDNIVKNRPVITPIISDARSSGSYLDVKRGSRRSRVPIVDSVSRSTSTGKFL